MMYPMVQQQCRQQRIQQQQQQQQQQQPTTNSEQEDIEDIEQQESTSQLRHRTRRPLYRRFFSYVREAWTGVKFALGKPHTMYNFKLSLRLVRL